MRTPYNVETLRNFLEEDFQLNENGWLCKETETPLLKITSVIFPLLPTTPMTYCVSVRVEFKDLARFDEIGTGGVKSFSMNNTAHEEDVFEKYHTMRESASFNALMVRVNSID